MTFDQSNNRIKLLRKAQNPTQDNCQEWYDKELIAVDELSSEFDDENRHGSYPTPDMSE